MKLGHSIQVVALAAACAAAQGCGSSSSSTQSSQAPSSSSQAQSSSKNAGAISAAKAAFAKYHQPQPADPIPALRHPPKTGLKVTITTCPLPVCAVTTNAAKQAAGKLGWTVTTLDPALTPEAYKTAINQILQKPPALTAITPVIPNPVIATQLKALQTKKIPVVEMAAAANTFPSATGPVQAVVAGGPQFTLSGNLMGSAVVADAGGPANTVFIWDPSLAVYWLPVKQAFTKVVEGAGGKVGVVNVNQQQIGTGIPTQVVSYLQANPNVKYLAFSVADLVSGVPQALKAAGLSSRVKIISRAPQSATMADIKSGAQWASIGEENPAAGWRSMDQLARISEGIDLGSLRNPPGWHQIYTQDNVTTVSTIPQPPDYQSVYLKAWGVK